VVYLTFGFYGITNYLQTRTLRLPTQILGRLLKVIRILTVPKRLRMQVAIET
jgi:hypothetical protein